MFLVIRGKVQDWRIARRNAWRIVEGYRGTEDAGPEVGFNPLPYDDEIDEAKERAEEKANRENYEIMQEALKTNYFNTPIWQKGTS